ncbi:Tetratricopeptide repeat-containing protein [Ferrimonas sediminum]|uniref:Tetratricopeptide repeat-containing protein n=1 Tax=Ferrimonas sediminum TaxID=718193 RepID=A0A1G8RF52_9GAMM|nr:hypothetical protein [Ferrimonas sediminum]SDJ15551.1 Tetratricopeptide repeat-containing protein [Ferrimonas sediminum]
MRMKSKLLPALLLATLGAGAVAPVAQAVEKCPADERKTKVVSERVGKKIQKAFELYSADQLDEALALLLEIDPRKDFDKAYVNRFIGNIYAGKEGKAQVAMKHLQLSVDADLLGGTDQAQAMRLLADLRMQEKNYKAALKGYKDWMAFTCKEDMNVYLRMGSAQFELKQFDKVIPLADNAIRLQKKPSKNAYVLKMGSYYESKQYKKAAAVVEDMVALFPEESKLWVQLAQMYMLSENYTKALYTMDVAYRQDLLEKPSHYKMLAQLYAQNEIPYRSAVIQEEYLSNGMVEKDESALSMLANTYHQAKEIAKAAKYYGEAAALTNNAKHYTKQAALLLESQKYKAAQAAGNKALKADGLKSAGQVQMILAQAYFYNDQFKEAYKACKAATKDKKTKKAATSWLSYIEDTAKRKKVSI